MYVCLFVCYLLSQKGLEKQRTLSSDPHISGIQ